MLVKDDVPGLDLVPRSEEFEAKESICKEEGEGEGETISSICFCMVPYFVVIYNVTLTQVGTCKMTIVPFCGGEEAMWKV